ncbi:hypothetical protein NQ318_014748 [Aromia moschata]|uniref:Uncharacterized protein n=1 Tax=Aromia moschata TaxID=1265417 RepID=A0AAV8ZDS6_9CUCU|nr:hypothetical protein NQ318_014748 [Aromia moschata]
MQDVPIALRQRLWYLHDGALAHFSHQLRRHLNRVFRGRWIGRGNDAPINWPSRSPDLNAADFYLWGHTKSLVYSSSVNSEEELRLRIVEAFNAIRNIPDVFTRIRFNFIRRLRACVEAHGGQFEHLLLFILLHEIS